MNNVNQYVAASAIAVVSAAAASTHVSAGPSSSSLSQTQIEPFVSASAASSAIGASTQILSVSSTLTYVDRLLIEYGSVVAVLARSFPRAIISADYLTDPEYGGEIKALTVAVPSATVDQLIEWESKFYKLVAAEPYLLELSKKVTLVVS